MSIYNTSTWSAGTTYNTNGIVKYGVFYYYSLVDTNLANTPSPTSTKWGGVTVFNGQTIPNFFWRPSYGLSTNQEPIVDIIAFEGYEQRIPHSINNNLLDKKISFELRNAAETTAITHFFTQRNGANSFVFTPLPPYDLAKLFKCPNWNVNFNFFDNYTIAAMFMEVNN